MEEFDYFSPGDRFGDYVIVKLLGKGGMGAVYLAKSPSSANLYAIKVMVPPDGPQRHEWRRRFVQEAEFAMRVRHPNLISVYDVGEDPATEYCYIIMDYMPGGSLSDRIKAQGKLDIRTAIDITIKIASALDVVHKAGIVHRDVKPDNIMFDADGSPKLSDLGIAKVSGRDDDTNVTKTGMLLGTPAYMSPEQMMNSHEVDARADIYSLGMVLYEMLTGRRPNDTSTIVQLLAKAIQGEELPDVRTVRPEVSVAVSYVLSKMVAVKPEARPASAVEVARLLYDAATGKLLVKPAKETTVPSRKGPVRLSGDAMSRSGDGAKGGGVAKWVVAALGAAALCAAAFFGTRSLNAPKKDGRDVTRPTVVTNTVVERIVRDAPLVVTNTIVREIAHVVTNVDIRTDSRPRLDDSPNGRKISSPKEDVAFRVEESIQSDVTGEDGVRSAEVNGYRWYYRVENDKAVLCRRNLPDGRRPCIEPAPVGRVVVPKSLDGRNVIAIDDAAFMDCSMMTEIELPEGLEEIREWQSFYHCTGLKEVTFPESLRRCGTLTFDGCTNLKRVNIMNCDKADSGFGCLFDNCHSLGEVLCSAKNPVVTSVGGVLYSKDRKTLLAYPKTRKNLRLLSSTRIISNTALVSMPYKHVKIPEGIEYVSGHNFEFDDRGIVEAVEFPRSLKRLGVSLFKGTSTAKKVIFNGDAPELDGSPFSESTSGIIVEVKRGSKGWNGPGSTDLPEKWPLNAGADARRIRYIK